MATIYRHSFFVKHNKKGIKRFNYYMAKGVLLNEGYKLISYNKDWKERGKGEICFSDGVFFATIRTDVKKNENTGNYSCGDVLDIHEWTTED